jgi:beta-lactamase regulating signal transducer with metallopeptidase domain/polyisoprenoid-binding protein YceI
MLISWMGYAFALSMCAAFVGLVLDKLASIWGAPRRWAWIAVLIASVATSPVLAVRPAPAAAMVRTAYPAAITASAQLPWNAIAFAIWSVGTLACLALILRDLLRVARRRSLWRRTRVDGVVVFLSNDDGPAVVGLRHPAIVLPTWSLALSPHQRSLMLRHEREHVTAGDYHVAFFSSLAVALLPWCLGLWWIARRLRLAIEIDCDARVLGATANPREYGLLLIAVGARQSLSLPFAMSLAERLPLEERIRAMTAVRPSRPTMASMPLVALGMLTVIALAKAPLPAPLVNTTHANTPSAVRVAQRPVAFTKTSMATAEPLRPIGVGRAAPEQVSARAKTTAAPGTARHLSFVVDSRGAVAANRSHIRVNVHDLKSGGIVHDQYIKGNALASDSFPTALFVPRSVDGLATKSGADSAPFSMVGDLTVHGVTRPVTWVGSARSKGDTVRGTAHTSITFEDFGLAAPRKTLALSARDSIRLEYDFDFVTVKQ